MSSRQPYRAEQDGWTENGDRIDAAGVVDVLRKTLDESGPIIVEWWHYRGASAPDRLIFDDFEAYEAWVRGIPPGDDIWVWNWESACTRGNAIAHGKQPDDDGKVPLRGPY